MHNVKSKILLLSECEIAAGLFLVPVGVLHWSFPHLLYLIDQLLLQLIIQLVAQITSHFSLLAVVCM